MGVMTMKMISSTSITSTMGVTLMSATGGGAFFFFISNSFFGVQGADCDDPPHARSTIQLADHSKSYFAAPARCVRFRK